MRIWSKRQNRKKYKATITNVLLGSYIRALVISMILGVILFIGITGKELSYRQSVSDKKVLSFIKYVINTKLDDIKKFSDELITDDELHDIFSRNHEIRKGLLGSLLMRKMAQQDFISSIHIVFDDSVISELKYPVYNYNQRQTIEDLEVDSRISLRGDSYWDIGTDNVDATSNTFYYVCKIKSKMDMEQLGYLIAFVDISRLQKEVEYYYDKELDIIIRSASDNIITFPNNIPTSTLAKYLDIINRYYNNWRELPGKYNANVLSSIDSVILSASKQSSYRTNLEFAIVYMLIIIIEFTIIASIVLNKRVIGPLELIAKRAKEISNKGNLNIQFPGENYYSEADDISNALNEMMAQIRRLLEDVEKREKLQRQLELSVINHQIKPHFLYNTLNAASILVSVEEKESAKQLITTLASYYRATLNHGNDIISLESELNIVRDYVKIALIRNPNIVKLNYDIDDSLLNLQIPKMTIQTLVENSIKYGIKAIDQPISITIKVRKLITHAEIIVEDDGIGMSTDTIDRVMKGERLEAKSGFGLKSVLNRIALINDNMSLKDIMEIQSEPNSYTRIIIRLKYK